MLISPLFNGCGNCLFNAPPKLNNSLPKRVLIASHFFSPLAYGHRFATIGVKYIATRIGSLLFSCSPFAVLGRVISIIIQSVYAVLVRRPFSHIGNKPFKSKPFFTDGYASRSIVFIIAIIGVVAPLNHCGPNGVFRSSPKAMRCSFASARLSSSRSKLGCICKVCFSAFTDTLCFICSFTVIGAFTCNSKETEFFTNHNKPKIIINHT